MRQRKEKLLTNVIPKKNNADADKVLIRLLTICHASNNKLYIYIYICNHEIQKKFRRLD